MQRNALTLAMLLLATAPAPALALTIVDQERFVEALVCEAGTSGPCDSERIDAADAGPFLASASAALGAGPMAEASGDQDSRIETDRVIASGNAAASTSDGTYFVRVQSSFELFFDLVAPTAFSLVGAVFAEPTDSALGGVELFQVGTGEVFSLYDDPFDGGQSSPFSVSGVLDPGSYRLYAFAGFVTEGCDPGECTGSGAYSFQFVVPEPATGLLTGIALAGLAAARRRGSSA